MTVKSFIPTVFAVCLFGCHSAPAPEVGDAEGETTEEESSLPGGLTAGSIWDGYYDCAQGKTLLQLILADAGDGKVRARFDFDHLETDTQGSFWVEGQTPSSEEAVTLSPTEWVNQPKGHEMLAMNGKLIDAGTTFEGKIESKGCGEFYLARAEPGEYGDNP